MRQIINIPLQIKSLSAREFEGHGSIFGNIDLGGDVVMPGAFDETLSTHKQAGTLPQMFWMHRPDMVPGKWLDMHEDTKGLKVRGILADTDLGNEMRTLLDMNAVRGLSIGYVPNEAEYDSDGTRILKSVDLWEVSLVSLAMNPLAQIEAVKARLSATGEYVPSKREFEHALRDVGCSAKMSKFMVAKIFGNIDTSETDATNLRDADDAMMSQIIDRLNNCAAQIGV